MEQTPEKTGLELACEAAKGSSRLAQLLTARGRKVSKASISRWKKEQIPAAVCPDIEALTGVRCELLRPDVHWEVLRTCPAEPAGGKPAKKARSASRKVSQVHGSQS